MAHPFTYVELHTQDTARAQDFYRRLFDWKMSDSPTPVGPYTEIDAGEGLAAGLMKIQQPAAPSHWLTYVRVDDVHASLAKARALGGDVLAEVAPVPEVGWFAVVRDPTGAPLGLFQKAPAK